MRLDVSHVRGDFRADRVNTKPFELPSAARCPDLGFKGPQLPSPVHCTCLLLPESGHLAVCRVRFRGRYWVKRTWRFALHMSAFDPKRTSGRPLTSLVGTATMPP